jgi:hypothetical protein
MTHRVEWIHQGGYIEPRVICEAGPDADCWYTCADGCDAWQLPLLVGTDGLRWHLVRDPGGPEASSHPMKKSPVGCSLVEFAQCAVDDLSFLDLFAGDDDTPVQNGDIDIVIEGGEFESWDYA